jgi:hypothetical protein
MQEFSNYDLLTAQPSVRQLTRLAGRSILFAQRHNMLQIDTETENEQKRYKVLPTKTIERPGVMDGAPVGYLYHRSTQAIISQVALNSWSMLYSNVLDIEEFGSRRPGLRDSYIFEWDSEGLKRADRGVIITPAAQNYRDIYDTIDNFHVDDEMATMWDAETQMVQVNAGDVDLLIHELDLRIASVDVQGEDYSEKRKNYFDYDVK